ncbi:MAG: hypothetical protein MJ252_08255 [archaeon]|nr:hypothetical protein [archaeon]
MQPNTADILYLDASTPISEKDIKSSQAGIEAHRQVCLTFTLYNALPQAPYQIKLSIKKEGDTKPEMIGYTAPHVAQGNPTIIFNLNFIIDYFFEKSQSLIINLARGNDVAQAPEILLSSILKAQNSSLYLDIPGAQERIFVTANELNKTNKKIKIDLKIEGYNQPIFYVLKKSKYESGATGVSKEFVACYKSEITTNGVFKTASLPSAYIDYGDHSRSVVIEMYDQGVLAGSKEITMMEILPKTESVQNALENKNLVNLEIGKFSVYITAVEEQSEKKNFVQLLNGGLDFNMEIGIDFTGSNGHYLDKDTLHYIPPGKGEMTLYEKAIYECGRVLENYDSDKVYPVFGFGACPPGSKEVSHCFPLTLAVDNNPNINGLQNVLKIYRENMPKLTFSGPTYFAPMLYMMFSIISSMKAQNPMAYHVILLLTDGMINDLEETVECIVNASDLPVSLVIIGVGDADFEEMKFLDCDNGRLESALSGKRSTRDLVQFVEYKSVGNNPKLLAEKVLEELPEQVEKYFDKYGN